MDYKQRAVEMFSSDKFAIEQTGVEIIEVGEQNAKCKIDIEPRHLNARGNVMGGAIFTLADFAFGMAANTPKGGCVTLNASISYVRPATGSVLYAEAKCVKEGRTISFYNVTVTDDSGKIVAEAQFNGFRS